VPSYRVQTFGVFRLCFPSVAVDSSYSGSAVMSDSQTLSISSRPAPINHKSFTRKTLPPEFSFELYRLTSIASTYDRTDAHEPPPSASKKDVCVPDFFHAKCMLNGDPLALDGVLSSQAGTAILYHAAKNENDCTSAYSGFYQAKPYMSIGRRLH